MRADTIPNKVLQNAVQVGDKPAYYEKRAGTWQATSWSEYGAQVKAAAKALVALGVEPGQVVTIIGFNRPEWIIMDMAAMAVGAVPAGIYTTNSPAECEYILNHSESPILLAEDEGQWKKIAEVREQLPHLRHVVMMRDTPEIGDDLVMGWDEFMAAGAEIGDDALDARLDGLAMDGLATLIYTSGTTGPPKGVMLSHDNLVWTATQSIGAFSTTSEDVSLSYLPLSHIAEQMFSLHVPAVSGASIYFAESIEALADNLKEVRPTIFFAVPRVWEKFYAGIQAQLGSATGAKAKIASWAMGVGHKVNVLRTRGEEPTGALALQYKLADRLVFQKVKAAVGLDRCRVPVSGAAPVNGAILEFFAGLDIVIYEVYGQSEGSGPTTVNVPGKTEFGSVGPPFPGTEVKIADDGEILLKGRNVFLGYYKDEAATAETLQDGWLHSGDLGRFDSDGMLHITGRKKDIIITAGGKNIAPKAIEAHIKHHHLVGEAVVIGDRRKYLTAVISLDDEACAAYLAEHGISGPAHEADEIHREIHAAVEAGNQNLARVEQIKKFHILHRQLTIADGELTPTLKVKRNVVNEHFAEHIEAMYAE